MFQNPMKQLFIYNKEIYENGMIYRKYNVCLLNE